MPGNFHRMSIGALKVERDAAVAILERRTRHTLAYIAKIDRRIAFLCERDRSGEADETRSGSAEGEGRRTAVSREVQPEQGGDA